MPPATQGQWQTGPSGTPYMTMPKTGQPPSQFQQPQQNQQPNFGGFQNQQSQAQLPFPDFGNWNPSTQNYYPNFSNPQSNFNTNMGFNNNPSFPTPQFGQQLGNYGTAGFDLGNQQTYLDGNLRGGLQSYMENVGMPLYDRGREDFWRGMDTQEAQFQFRSELERNLANDNYQRQLSTRGQSLSEWMASQNLGLAQGQQAQDLYLGQQGFQTQKDVAGMYSGAQMHQANKEFDAAKLYSGATMRGHDVTRELGIAQLNLDRMVQTGMLGQQEYANETQRLNQIAQQEHWRSQIGLGQFEADTARKMGLGQLELGRGDLALRGELGRGELDVSRGDLALRGELGRGQLGINQFQADTGRYSAETDRMRDMAQLELDRRFQNGQLDLQEYANQTARLEQEATAQFQRGQLGIGQFEADTGRFSAQTQRMLGTEQNAIQRFEAQTNRQVQIERNALDRAYNEGKISNEQRSIALAELTQQQNNALQWAQQNLGAELGRGELDVSRGQLGLAGREQAYSEVYRQQQLQQQLQELREQLSSQERQGAMAAFGRYQAPTVRYQRNWT